MTPDDELIASLRGLVAELDPVPDEVRAAAQAAITTRDLDGELAVLVADSAAGEQPGAGPDSPAGFEPVRTAATGGQGRWMLSFEGGGIQVDLEVTEHGGRVDVIGIFNGVSPQGCVLEGACGERRELDVDSLGRFLVSDAPRGPVRVRCSSVAGAVVTTAWVRL
jgi:hypothetical protein